MAAQLFYQTFYQSETLFRLADEPWEVVVLPAETASPIVPLSDATDLFAELDTLLVESELVVVESILPEILRMGAVPDEQTITPDLAFLPPEIAEPENVPEQTDNEPDGMLGKPELLPLSVPRPKTPSIVPPVQQKSRLPQLNHKVLLLADEELDPSNLIFLEKILNAVNLNVDGVDLLNLHGVQDIDFAELLQGKYINHFITFGVPFERIHLDIMMDRYAPVRFDGITFLMTDSLPTIEADVNLKKRLWNSLQRVFLQW